MSNRARLSTKTVECTAYRCFAGIARKLSVGLLLNNDCDKHSSDFNLLAD